MAKAKNKGNHKPSTTQKQNQGNSTAKKGKNGGKKK